MESFLYYLLRASILMALFYSFYKIFFATTFHAINRFLLLGLVLTTILLPFLRFGLIPRKEVAPLVFDSLMIDFSAIPGSEAGEAGFAMDIPWVPLLTGLFVVGLLFSFVRYLIGVSQVIAIIRRSEKQFLADNTVIHVTDKNISPFSWMNYIVFSREELSMDNGAIIRHEQAHVRSKHSMDMVFFDLFTCLFWFNPFSWLLRREIQTIHEYQADQRVLDRGVNSKQYQLLLIRESVGEQKFALANNFHRRDLHKRITMMMKNKTNNRMKWSYAMVLPALFLAVTLLSIPKLNASIRERELDEIEKKDSLGGGSEKNVEIIVRGFDGKKNPLVIVDGKKITHDEFQEIKSENIESVSVLKNKSAVDVYGEEGKDGVILITTKKKPIIRSNDNVNLDGVLIVIDGEKMDSDFKLSSIIPEEIESISVLKNKSAVDLYGEEGANGVVIIEKKRDVLK